MNHHNRLLPLVLQKLVKARRKPPTVTSQLLAWSSLPSLVLVAAVCVAALVALGLPSPVPILVGGIFLGGALRDVGIAYRVARYWPIQEELFDWQKIDALAQSAVQPQSAR